MLANYIAGGPVVPGVPTHMIIKNRRAATAPLVSITSSEKSPQVRLAFNSSLARLAQLEDKHFAAVDLNAKAGTLKFRVVRSAAAVPHSEAVFPLMPDGGSKGKTRAARMITLPKKSIPLLPVGKYLPKLVLHDEDSCSIAIDLKSPRRGWA